MKYRLLPNPKAIRDAFIKQYILSYQDYYNSHKNWISSNHINFTEDYYNRMFMWDKFINANKINFIDALSLLREKDIDVLFMAESSTCSGSDFCELNKQPEAVAIANSIELAECISYEWFTSYELYLQDIYFSNSILPEDLYVFDDTFTWFIVFTHHCTADNVPDSRFCLYYTRGTNND